MGINENILNYLSVYGKAHKYKIARQLKIDVSQVTKATDALQEEGKIEVKEGSLIPKEKIPQIQQRYEEIKQESKIADQKKTKKREMPAGKAKKISKAEILKEVPEEQYFVLADGRKLKNAIELADALETMSEETFRHHVSESKNDFSNWVSDAFYDNTLAENISKAGNRIETRTAILKKLGKEISEAEEQPSEVSEEPAEEEIPEHFGVKGEEKIEGAVKFFNPNKGFGFIIGDDGKEYYVHGSGLNEGVIIEANDRVSFKAVQGPKGPKAEEVENSAQSGAQFRRTDQENDQNVA